MKKNESRRLPPQDIEVAPLTPNQWKDFVTLFGANGACAGCWCMYERLTSSEFRHASRERNRRAMKTIVNSGRVPGILAYVEGKPVGWCSVSPREQFHRLQNARGIPDSGGKRIWSVVCFFIHTKFTSHGVARKLLRAAIDYALSRGAEIIEAYPVDTRVKSKTNQEAWPGIASMFEGAGFQSVSQRYPTRPTLRLVHEGQSCP